MHFTKIMAVALGGATGSVGRYLIALASRRLSAGDFPAGTFIANILGCLMIGFFWCWFDKTHISNEFRLFLFTGFLGGFTTFSTYGRESVQLIKSGELIQAIGYILVSNIVGLGLVAVGFLLADKLFKA